MRSTATPASHHALASNRPENQGFTARCGALAASVLATALHRPLAHTDALRGTSCQPAPNTGAGCCATVTTLGAAAVHWLSHNHMRLRYHTEEGHAQLLLGGRQKAAPPALPLLTTAARMGTRQCHTSQQLGTHASMIAVASTPAGEHLLPHAGTMKQHTEPTEHNTDHQDTC